MISPKLHDFILRLLRYHNFLVTVPPVGQMTPNDTKPCTRYIPCVVRFQCYQKGMIINHKVTRSLGILKFYQNGGNVQGHVYSSGKAEIYFFIVSGTVLEK